jgi:hypothetical protein
MSAAGDRRYPEDLLRYGSDRMRDSEDNSETPTFAGAGRSRRGLAAPDWTRIVEGTRFAGDVAVQQLREGRSLDPELLPERPRSRQPRRFGMFARLVFIVVIAAAAAFLIVHLFPNWRGSGGQMTAGPVPQPPASATTGVQLAAVEPTKPAPASSQRAGEPISPRPPKPVLRPADEPNQTAVGEAVPLGLNVEGSTDGVIAVVTGLLPGSNLSVGNAVSPTIWHLQARDLPRVLVRPPSGFSGTMEVVVDLQVGGDQIVDRRWRRLEWTAARPARAAVAPEPPAAPAARPAPPPDPWPAPAVRAAPPPEARVAPAVRAAPVPEGRATRTLDPEEMAVLVRRGEQLIETGDLPSARLLLRRAAEAGDARAAFALAGTYDPLVLSRLGVFGFAPDLATARQWYQRAAESGSREAAARLDMLASTGSR